MRLIKLLHPITKALVVLILAAGSAHASSVVYSFAGTGGSTAVAFQLTAPNFINPPLGNPGNFEFFSCAQLDSSTNCEIGIFFSNQIVLGAFSAQLQFDAASDNTAYAYFFPTGAFGAPGTYTSSNLGNNGTLTVTQTPEPSTILLSLIGVGCCFGLIRLRAKMPEQI